MMNALAILILGLVLASPAYAGVHRCLIKGSVVYQDTPCQAGGGSVLNVDPGPSPEEVFRAQTRLMQDRQEVRAIDAGHRREEFEEAQHQAVHQRQAEAQRRYEEKRARKYRRLEHPRHFDNDLRGPEYVTTPRHNPSPYLKGACDSGAKIPACTGDGRHKR